MARRLVTFEGWDGQWWRKIKVGKAIWDAGMFVLPWKISLGIGIAQGIGEEVGRRGALRKRSTSRRQRYRSAQGSSD